MHALSDRCGYQRSRAQAHELSGLYSGAVAFKRLFWGDLPTVSFDSGIVLYCQLHVLYNTVVRSADKLRCGRFIYSTSPI